MTFRTYAWFYGNDYQLINIHDARQKNHPYYGDEQLYGATDVHSFTTYNFVREVTQRVVLYDEDNHGFRKVYEKGTPEWDAKFNKKERPRHSNELMYEKFIERPDGWFEFEISLGFTSVDLFESVTTAKRLAEILIVMYHRDDSGALIPAYQHVFQDCQLQELIFNVSLDDTFSHRIKCKAYYAKYEYQFYTDSKSNPMTHAFMRKTMSINESYLQTAKSRVQVASEYVRKMLSTPETTFLNYLNPIQTPKIKKHKIMLHSIGHGNSLKFDNIDIHPGELDDFYFCIAGREYSHTEFLNSLYVTPTEAKRANLMRVNPHLGKVISPGQIIYVVNSENDVYKKMRSHLNVMAQKIEALRMEHEISQSTFFSDYFALMGSYAESVGINPGEYYSLQEKQLDEKLATIKTLDDINAYAGIATVSGEKFFELLKNKIEMIDEAHYTKAFQVNSREAQIIGFKNIREHAHIMFDELKNGVTISPDGAVRSGLIRESPIQRWVVKGGKLVSLDSLYKSVVNTHGAMKFLGVAGIGFDALHTSQRVVESCTVFREDACRETKFEEWGGFVGRAAAGAFVAAGLTLVPVTGGLSLVIAIGANALLNDPMSKVGGNIGKSLGVLIDKIVFED